MRSCSTFGGLESGLWPEHRESGWSKVSTCVCVSRTMHWTIPLWYVCVPVIGTMYRDAICMKIGAGREGKREQYKFIILGAIQLNY